MNWLPKLPNDDGIRKKTQIIFKGYDHNLGAENGTLWDMENVTGDVYPLLSTRAARKIMSRLEEPHALYGGDGVFYVDGTGFYANGEYVGEVTAGEKTFVTLSTYLLIFPDKKYYRRDNGEFGSLEAEWMGTVTIGDGTYNGAPATANAISISSGEFPFSTFEAVTISGCDIAENNKTPVIQEVSEDKRQLRFLENCFTETPWTGTVTIKREVPDMDYLCQNENRVWGCKGDMIFCSFLGNPFIWNNYDAGAMSSWNVESGVGSAGDFTGCCSFLGYPVFFKEDNVYKVYGNKPSNFEVIGSANLGVERGADKSLAVAGETLFYLSRAGIVAYSGGTATLVNHAFGNVRYKNAVAGSDGVKYFVSMESVDGEWSLFVFDTTTRLWHREDSTHALGFAWDGELYCLNEQGDLFMIGTPRAIPEDAVDEGKLESFIEFNDFTDGSPDKKGVSKLQIRADMDEGAEITVLLKFDSEEEWRKIKTVSADRKRSFIFPVIPRRCDHWRLRIEGKGQYRIYSIAREFYNGSELQ